ncbi:MAG: diguanylate cyclase [Acidobacteriota bacterium]|jgi:diguanylate cyclase (GGDEF)-like protein
MEQKPTDEYHRIKALQDLGSTMSFSTLIEADRLANLALGMAIEFTRSGRGFLLLFSPQGSTRYSFGIDLSAASRQGAPPPEVLEAMDRARRDRGIVQGEVASGGRPFLAVPMVVEGDVVGVLYLDRPAGGEPFRPPEIQAAELAAGQLGISMTARYLYEQMTEKRRQVELIDKVSKAVNTPVDLDNVLALVLATAREGLDADGAALLLAEEGGPLEVRCVEGMTGSPLSATADEPRGRLLRAAMAREAPQIHGRSGDAGTDPRAAVAIPVKLTLRDKRIFNERRRTAYSVPFSKVLGVLYLERREAGAEFTEDDLFVLQVFADHITTAVTNDALYQQASTDTLTGLASRRYLDSRLQDEVEFAGRTRTSLSVVLIDLDDFKALNDTHGHQAGDQILRQIGRILRGSVRKFDICGRYGGEEFILALPETDTRGALVVAENVRDRVASHPFLDPDEPVAVTASLGIATFPAHGDDVHGIIGAADAALYEAKKAGKNRHAVAPPPARATGGAS